LRFVLPTQITPLQSVVLGLVQGLTEFIPVSSSAHLNITHALMGQGRNLGYDVMLSIGTTIALIWYFRYDWKELLLNPQQKKLRNYILLACVPGVVLGYVLKKAGIEERPPVSEVWFNAVLLVLAGLVLLWSDRVGRRVREMESINLTDALVVGTSQALALFPGISRSGATLTAGLFRGMTRETAARFSFLMSLPINVGATVFALYDDYKHHGGWAAFNASPGVMLLGILVSAASGFWAIGFLLNFLKKRNVVPFVLWRFGVAALVFLLIYLGYLPAIKWQ
jgi:undecaprenyl-diphosphatase